MWYASEFSVRVGQHIYNKHNCGVLTNSNRKLTGISHSCIIRWLPKEFILLPYSQRLKLSSWRYCPMSIHYSLNNSGVMYLHKLYQRYSTSFGERESRPFREEPETFISILISTTTMHLEPFVMHSALPARPLPLVRSLQLEVWPYLEERKNNIAD